MVNRLPGDRAAWFERRARVYMYLDNVAEVLQLHVFCDLRSLTPIIALIGARGREPFIVDFSSDNVMDSDTYGHHNLLKPTKSTKKIFSFGLSGPRESDKLPQHGGTNSTPSFVFNRAMKSSQERASFDQSRNGQHHSPAHFQTSQRTVLKQEPVSRRVFSALYFTYVANHNTLAPGSVEDYQILTHPSNTKLTGQFHPTNYQPRYEAKNAHQYLPTLLANPMLNPRTASLAPSNRSGSQSLEVDDDEFDLSDLMNRRMKEAKMIKTQLAEEV